MLAVVDVPSFVEVLMTVHDDDQARRVERAREVGLFRYALVRAAADPALSPRARGALVRELAAAEHVGPFGQRVLVGRSTLDRWVRAWRAGGFDALVPPVRQVQPRTQAQVLDLAAALKRERPERTAAQVRRVVVAHLGWAPSERTLQRLFVRLELNTRPQGRAPRVFGRFEASHPNQLWISDALCRKRHNASYGDQRIMPIGAARVRRLALVATGRCHSSGRHKYPTAGRICLCGKASQDRRRS